MQRGSYHAFNTALTCKNRELSTELFPGYYGLKHNSAHAQHCWHTCRNREQLETQQRRVPRVVRHPGTRTSEDKLKRGSLQKRRLRRKIRIAQVCEKLPEHVSTCSRVHVRRSKEVKFQKERFTLDAVEILCDVTGALMWIATKGREQSLQNRLNLHLPKLTQVKLLLAGDRRVIW